MVYGLLRPLLRPETIGLSRHPSAWLGEFLQQCSAAQMGAEGCGGEHAWRKMVGGREGKVQRMGSWDRGHCKVRRQGIWLDKVESNQEGGERLEESGGGVGTLDSFQNPRWLNTSERGLGGHLTQHLAVYI